MAKHPKWEDIPGFDAVKEEYVQLHTDEWLTEHRIADEGQRRGAQNEPAATDDVLDSLEAEIVAWVNRRGRVCRENVSGHLANLERELENMETDVELDILAGTVGELRNDAAIALEEGLDAGRNGLAGPQSELRVGVAEFERFRRGAGITRLADYSHRGEAKWVIGPCFLVEIILNGTLLMDVMPTGLLGSVGLMGLISAVNVLILGLGMGVLLRQKNHVRTARKAMSWGGIAAIVLLILVFNLLVGHFRNSLLAVEQAGTDPLTVGGDVFARAFAAPLDLGSFQTALLVLLGIAFFGISAWKWYQRDDPYPGYGKLHRQLKATQDAYLKAYEDAQERFSSTHQNHLRKLDDQRQALLAKQSTWRETRRRGQWLVRDYPTNALQYQADLNRMLAAYRSANRETRTEPAPPHFDLEKALDDAILEPPEFRPPAGTNIANVAESVHLAIEALQGDYRVKRREFPTLEVVEREAAEAVDAAVA